MDYVEWRLRVPAEAVEAVANLLHEAGSGGVVLDDEVEGSLRAYFPVDRWPELQPELARRIEALQPFFAGWSAFEAGTRRVREQDWANAWKAHFHTQKVGRRLVIRPSWERYVPEREDIIIVVDPGMAFGTGTHPTTVLCLEALENLTPAGGTVLDLGTGSGILAVAAAHLGADRVDALDIDPVAVRVARENVRRNGVADRVRVSEGEISGCPDGAYDLVVANITADVLAGLTFEFRRVLRPGGILLLSGIIPAGEEKVRGALEEAGFSVADQKEREGWLALLARARL